jgi:hypothetical protein
MSDRDDLRHFLSAIRMPEGATELLMDYRMDDSELSGWRGLLYEDPTAFFSKMSGCTDEKLRTLYVYVRLGMEMRQAYLDAGVSEQVYYDTFYDLSLWCDWCRRHLGEYGMVEAPWYVRLYHALIFRLGRLEFEKGTADRDFSWSGGQVRRGDKVIGVHIPEGGPLLPEKCDESFRRAEALFGPEYPIYTCDSWLTSPALLDLLGPDSNIRAFQSRFEVVDVTYPFPLAEQRVWGVVQKDKSRYSEDTSLRRNLKRYLMDGGRIGMGLGVMARPGA